MKKIAIVGAAGRQGTCLVNEAVARGYEVTGFCSQRAQNCKSQSKDSCERFV